MKRRISFYKKEERWYALLEDYIAEGGTESDTQMVLGADSWLNKLDETNSGMVTLDISLIPESDYCYLIQICKDEYGSVYSVEGTSHLLWLCPVCLWVFGIYPETIYYKKVLNG